MPDSAENSPVSHTDLAKFLQLAESFQVADLITGHPLAEQELSSDDYRAIPQHISDRSAPGLVRLNPEIATARQQITNELIEQAKADLSANHPVIAFRVATKTAKTRARQKLQFLTAISKLNLDGTPMYNISSISGKIGDTELELRRAENKRPAPHTGAFFDPSTGYYYDYTERSGGKLKPIDVYRIFTAVSPILRAVNRMAMVRVHDLRATAIAPAE